MSAVTLTLLPDDPTAAQRIVNLTNDLAAVRRALARTIDERNLWRSAYLQLDSRLCALDGVQREEIELRGDQVVRL